MPHRLRANQEVKEKFIKLYQELKGMEPKEAVDRFLFEAQKHRNWFNLRFAGFNKPPTKKLCRPLSIQIDQDGVLVYPSFSNTMSIIFWWKEVDHIGCNATMITVWFKNTTKKLKFSPARCGNFHI